MRLSCGKGSHVYNSLRKGSLGMTARLGLARPPNPPKVCIFCGRAQEDVELLIAGAVCFICNECVDLCADIVARHRGMRWEEQWWRQELAAWSPTEDDYTLDSLQRVNDAAHDTESGEPSPKPPASAVTSAPDDGAKPSPLSRT